MNITGQGPAYKRPAPAPAPAKEGSGLGAAVAVTAFGLGLCLMAFNALVGMVGLGFALVITVLVLK